MFERISVRQAIAAWLLTFVIIGGLVLAVSLLAS